MKIPLVFWRGSTVPATFLTSYQRPDAINWTRIWKVAVAAVLVLIFLPSRANGQFGIDLAAILAALSEVFYAQAGEIRPHPERLDDAFARSLVRLGASAAGIRTSRCRLQPLSLEA
jgi:hypothetical protein